MLGRRQLLMAASLLLYLGPLLAGMSGMGWTAVPVFVFLFAFWLVVMRPVQWPRDLSLWTGQIVVAAAAQLAVNILIVVFLFAVGRGLSGLEGLRLHVSPLIPVALSFMATPLSRLVSDPDKAEAIDRASVSEIHPPKAANARPPETTSDEMVRVLLDLPPDADAMLIADALDVALQAPDGASRLRDLEALVDPMDPDRRALREAIIFWATDPRWAEADVLPGAAESAFSFAGNDPVLLHLFAHRALDLIRARPGLWTSFPDAIDVISRIEASSPENLQMALSALAAALEAAAGSD
jgi:hypothetical protein